jgi:hypothetical protein
MVFRYAKKASNRAKKALTWDVKLEDVRFIHKGAALYKFSAVSLCIKPVIIFVIKPLHFFFFSAVYP